jgi:pimeloyl-ACP methyl ester carboxylesterase
MAPRESAVLTTPDGTRITRWERVPADASTAVLFVHGATYAGRGAFDADGYSWLAATADAGRAAYAVDFRGYGDSEAPPELDDAPDAAEPVVRAPTAARDTATALDDLLTDYEQVHLVGYSWGTIVAGYLLTEYGVAVDSLVQYAPIYDPPEALRERFAPGDPPAAYRTVTENEARERWAAQRPDESVPDDAFVAFWNAVHDSGQRVGDTEIRAPNGTLVDLAAAVDERPYDAAAIEVPALVVRGSLDTASTRPDALALFDALGTDDRTYTEVAGGSHFTQLEAVRETLTAIVAGFHERVEAGDGHR